jgi:hypothetical protein
VLLAVLISTITVTVIKSLTHMDCPWDLVRYGGGKPFIGLFQARPVGMGKATACFPAGHASGGYAWLSLYFFLCSRLPLALGRACVRARARAVVRHFPTTAWRAFRFARHRHADVLLVRGTIRALVDAARPGLVARNASLPAAT